MFDGGSYVNEAFIKRCLTFSITVTVLLPTFIALFVPAYDGGLEDSLNAVTSEYYKMTGADPTNEEVWALSGIYTAVGVDDKGDPSTAWGTTRDGWVFGSRIVEYTPSQFKAPEGLNKGAGEYTVKYSEEKGLYYYTAAGSDLLSIEIGDSLEESTMYTSVSMDAQKKSSRFFTAGDVVYNDNGTFYFDFNNWRYVFQPLRDYKASNDLNVRQTTSSLSLIWYSTNYGDDGISGQLIINSANQGIAYLTAGDIIRAFDPSNYTSKFELIFNGLNINLYIQINPYAAQHYSITDCFNQGYWSILVTSPMITDSSLGMTLNSINFNQLLDTVISLLTFNTNIYGLSGMSATLAILFFNISFYTSLIAVALPNWKALAMIGVFGGIMAGINLLGGI